MSESSSHIRHINQSQIGNNTVVNQGNIQGDLHYHIPHPPTRAIVRIPYPRNEDVVYRPDLRDKLDALLPRNSKYCSAALWGLGGSGKTQLALDYAYRRCDDSECSVLWVHADSEATFSQDYKSIAKDLGVDANLKGEDLLLAVRDGIKALPQWVLILDNADDLAIFGVRQRESKAKNLDEYVPRAAVGTVLWTSRDEGIKGSLVGPRRGIEVARMTPSEAKQLLAISQDDQGEEDQVETVTLLEELQWLPLAISQAGAYMRRTETPIKEYLSLLEQTKTRWNILKENQHDRHRRHGVPNSILETWSISIGHLQRTSEVAYGILCVIAYVHNQDITHEMIEGIVKYTDEEPPEPRDVIRITRAITRLKEFSFLTIHKLKAGDRSYEMHKLVQEATRYGLSIGQGMQMDTTGPVQRSHCRKRDERYFSGIALQAVAEIFPVSERETWAACDRYLSHAIRVGEWAELCGEGMETCHLLQRVSDFLYNRGRWREKEPVDKRRLVIGREVVGEKHPDTIRSMADLAVTYHAQGRYVEAEALKLKTLELRWEVIGEKHPDTITSMASLAATYHAQGRYVEAEALELKTLELRREVIGEKHPDIITSMASLAATYHAQGRYVEAEALDLKTLELRRKVIGEKHPDTITSMTDLAATYYAQGRYVEAEALELKTLELRREVIGEKHPDIITSMALLAATYHAQGRYVEAEALVLNTLELQREVIGEKHPDTIASMASLAATYHAQGRYVEAEALVLNTLELQREVIGEKHPDTIASMASLAATYYAQGRRAEDEELSVKVLELRREALGENHPDTLEAMFDVAIRWNMGGRYDDALSLMHQCMNGQNSLLGLDHPSTRRSMKVLEEWS